MHSALRCAAGATDRHSRARTDFAHRFDVNFYRRLYRYIVHGKFPTNAFMPCGICVFLPSTGNFDAQKRSEKSEVETEFRPPRFLIRINCRLVMSVRSMQAWLASAIGRG